MKGNDGTGNVEERDDWQTPQWLFDKLNTQYDFVFDCCADHKNKKCHKSTLNFEGVNNIHEEIWDVLENYNVWMNPPFSQAERMFKHFFKVMESGVAIYRCDNLETALWQNIILKHATWIFIPKGRISYEGKVGKGSRFPSALIGFNVPVPNGLDGVTFIVQEKNNG